MWAMVLAAADAAGRHRDQLSLVVRANVHHSLVPLGADRPAYHGSVDQVASDVRRALEIGARQVILDLQASTRGVEEYRDLADAITVAARSGVAADESVWPLRTRSQGLEAALGR